MRVVTAKAKVADRRATRAVALPRRRLGEKREAVRRYLVERIITRRRRQKPRLERAEHFDQARDTRRRNGVADVALEGSDSRLGPVAPNLSEAVELDRVTARCTGRVALDEVDVLRCQACLRVR